MTQAEVILVQQSFQRVVPSGDLAAALFYARLFELDPAVRTLFSGEMREQGRKLMAMLGYAVSSLDDIDRVMPALRALGGRHARYGALEEHYATVGAALIWMLQKILGPEFTPAVGAAWTETYSLLATAMIEGQRSTALAA